MNPRALAVVAFLGILGAGSRAAPAHTHPPHMPPVQIEMRNVHLHLEEGVVAQIVRLRGDMRSLVEGEPPDFDDPRSYALYVQSAEMWMDMASLTELMNRHVFAYKGAPLSGISVRTTASGRLEQRAVLHKGVRVPVAMTASVTTTTEGKLRLHVESEKALGIGATGLLHLFGLKVQNLVHLDPDRGVAVAGDDIDLDLAKLLPPPRLVGRLTHVTIEGDRLHEVFGTPEARYARPQRLSRAQLHLLFRFDAAIRQADDDRCRPATD